MSTDRDKGNAVRILDDWEFGLTDSEAAPLLQAIATALAAERVGVWADKDLLATIKVVAHPKFKSLEGETYYVLSVHDVARARKLLEQVAALERAAGGESNGKAS